MRPAPTRFRRFIMLIVAGLAVLQLDIASARSVDRGDAGGCDEAIQCDATFCTTCAPLPTTGTSLIVPLVYLSEILPAELVGKLPKGKLTDIWRPPRTDTPVHARI